MPGLEARNRRVARRARGHTVAARIYLLPQFLIKVEVHGHRLVDFRKEATHPTLAISGASGAHLGREALRALDDGQLESLTATVCRPGSAP